MSDLLIASVDYLPSRGGAAMMAHHLANGFVDVGIPTRMLAPTQPTDSSEFPARYNIILDGEAQTRTREGEAWSKRELPRLLKKIEEIYREKPFQRALVTHPFYYGPALLEFCKARDIPLSTAFLGFELRSQLVHGKKLKFQQAVRRVLLGKGTTGPSLRELVIQLCRESDQVIPISNYTANLVRSVTKRNDIEVIGCGISLEDFHELSSRFKEDDLRVAKKLRRKLGLREDVPLVGCVNRLVESKNVSMFLEALALAPHLHGLIIGDGPLLASLQQRARELHIGERVTWLQNIPEERKWEYLAALDVFCLLSKEMPNGQVEGFGIVLLEASAAGTPVVCTRSGGMIDVVQHLENGQVVNTDDASALVDAFNRYLTDPHFSRRMVNAARKQILERYNWQVIAEKLAQSWDHDKL